MLKTSLISSKIFLKKLGAVAAVSLFLVACVEETKRDSKTDKKKS